MISHCYGAFKGHPRLEDKRWVSDKSQAESLIDDAGLAPTFLRVVVEIFSDIRLGSYLNALDSSHHLLNRAHLQIERARVDRPRVILPPLGGDVGPVLEERSDGLRRSVDIRIQVPVPVRPRYERQVSGWDSISVVIQAGSECV